MTEGPAPRPDPHRAADAEARAAARALLGSARDAALSRDPRAALLLTDDAPTKGSALTRPRLSLQVEAALVPPADEAALRTLWRARDPKAAVYLLSLIHI